MLLGHPNHPLTMHRVIPCNLSCSSLSALLLLVLSSGDSASSLGDFDHHNHPTEDCLVIFSLISPTFSQLYGFIPWGTSALIFLLTYQAIVVNLLLPLRQNVTAWFLCFSGFSYAEKRVSKLAFWLPHFGSVWYLVLRYYLDDLDWLHGELPTFQCWDCFAYAPLQCGFLCMHACPATFDVCSSVWWVGR